MLARRVEAASPIGGVKPSAGLGQMSCSELDDLLDELFADQIFRTGVVPSNYRPPESASDATQQRNGQQPICNDNNGGTPRSTATVATTSWVDSENDTRNPVKNQANDVTRTQKADGNTVAYPAVGSSSENGAENQVVAGGSRGRAPSLPVNHHSPANRYRRLQSVPCNDYYADSTISESYYDRSDRFVRGLCSEEPVTWLDRQKMKLQSRNENRWLSNQSDQQRRLVEELKAAQTTRREDRADEEEDPATMSPARRSQTLGGHQKQHWTCTAGSSTKMSDQLQGLDLLLQPREGSDAASCRKSDRNYYISGVEIPPSTTHQMKYVFSVSSPPPHSSTSFSSSACRVNSSDVVHQLDQKKVNARPGPPTPKRVSSRDALRQTLAARDWELEQWEQGSYTSLSSKSDVPDTSSVAGDTRNGSAQARQQPAFHSSSSVGCMDRSGTAYDAPRSAFRSTDGPSATDHNGLPASRRRRVDGIGAAGTTIQSRSSFDALLNGSSTSGTSSLSISSTSQSAFEPLQQLPVNDGHVTYGEQSAVVCGAVSAAKPSSKPEPDSVSVVAAASSQKSPAYPDRVADVRPSLSDFAIGQQDGTFGWSHSPTENVRIRGDGAPVHEKHRAPIPPNSSGFPPSDVVQFPAAAAASSSPASPKSQPYRRVSAPATTAALEKSSSLKKSEDVRGQALTGAGIRKQPVSVELEPPGNDGAEVISLQLIGPGMQKLEPEGDLPAVRPVTPKCLQPGAVGNSNPLNSRPKSLGNQRPPCSSEEEGNSHSRSVVHQRFDPGPRRATIYDHTIDAVVTSSQEQESGSRPELPDVSNGEDPTKQRLKQRRHTTSSGQDLRPGSVVVVVPGHRLRSSEPSSATESAFRRTERLLSSDLTAAAAQGGGGLLDRRGSASPSAAGRRRGSTLPAAATAASAAETRESGERTGRFDEGTDDVFTAKTSGPERRGSKAHKQREREREREANLALLDSAVAGLRRASASSPVNGSSSSSTVVQSTPPGKATPGLFLVRDPLSPRASIHPLSNGAVTTSSSNNSTDTTIRTNHAPRSVRDSSRFWHKPNISRDEVIACLKDKSPGSFVIRNSNSFPGAFGLALKVAHLPPNVQSRGGDPESELVRHFLIEPTSKGVKLKGCSSEPVFGSLAALVYQHSMTPLSLPCKLIIPDPSGARKREDAALTAASSDVTTSEALIIGATCNVLYINSVDMESLTGNEAVDKAVAATFATVPTPLTTVVQLKVSSQGVTLTDVNRKQFFRRHYPVDTVTFAGIDPEMRSWTWTNEETRSAQKSSIFGFVARKQGSPMDNACHVFAELDRDQPGDAIVDFIMKVMLGQG